MKERRKIEKIAILPSYCLERTRFQGEDGLAAGSVECLCPSECLCPNYSMSFWPLLLAVDNSLRERERERYYLFEKE
ncbi:hypothetical protein ACHAWT_006880 [Skeletonema menzelii]